MADDPITRARALAADWKAQKAYQARACRFDDSSPAELIQIAETGRDLNGVPLQDGPDIEALDTAWRRTFGEPLCVPCDNDDDGPGDDNSTTTGAEARAFPPGMHPLLAVDDEVMLRPRRVRELMGYARSTLKRDIKSGRFPKPQIIVPGKRHIGWPARQLKAWFHKNGQR